jgi:hypothetical protein
MRIAVLICGEPRFFSSTVQQFCRHILDPLRAAGHEVDCLLSLWRNRLVPGQRLQRPNHLTTQDPTQRVWQPAEHTAIIRMLRPVMSTFIEKSHFDVQPYVPKTNGGTNTYGLYSQHYSWYLAGQLLKIYEEFHGVYDCLIRTRLDLNFEHTIALPAEMNAIYVPAVEGHVKRPFNVHCDCNDQFALGPRNLMLPALQLVRHYDELLSAPFQWTPERLLHHFLTVKLGCGFRTFPLSYQLQR